MGVMKGAPNAEAARTFILEGLTKPEFQGNITSYIAYGPMRLSGSAHVDPDVAGDLPTDHMGPKELQFDYVFWSDHRDELQERFSAWLAL